MTQAAKKQTQAAKHQTQWAGQFGVAHELSRRGYIVAFTLGNTPGADLLCQSPEGEHFSIEVKTTSDKNHVIFGKRLLSPELDKTRHFVIAHVPKLIPGKGAVAPQYYVLNGEELQRLYAEGKRRSKEREALRKKPFAKFSPGIDFPLFVDGGFKDKWSSLPA